MAQTFSGQFRLKHLLMRFLMSVVRTGSVDKLVTYEGNILICIGNFN